MSPILSSHYHLRHAVIEIINIGDEDLERPNAEGYKIAQLVEQKQKG